MAAAKAKAISGQHRRAALGAPSDCLHYHYHSTFRQLLITVTLSSTTLLLLLAGFTPVHCEESGPLRSEKYFGSPLGALLGPGAVSGHVYIVDESTLFIRGFTFSGSSYQLTQFMGGSTPAPDGTGFIIPNESGSTRPLGDYKEKDIVIRLPEGRTVRDLKWISVWSHQVAANLGHVFIPPGVDVPSPLELPPLTGFAHGVRSGPISVIDAQTILVTDFWYDGEGPAGYWWVTRGAHQSPQGLRLKDENDKPTPLRAYRGEAFLIRLPDTKTVYDFDWFGVYCEEFQVDFGHVRLPQNVRVPPSPKMLGMKPESKLNCEILSDNRGFEVRWILDGDDIVMQLVAKLHPREYMSFGLGKDDHHSGMVGADAAVAWIDQAGTGHVVDYHLSSKEQCVGGRGACPDLALPGATSSTSLLHAAVVNGFSMVTFKRPQLGVDELYDQHIYSDGQQAVVWAVGPLNSRDEVSYHSLHNIGNKFIDFARSPQWNCPRPDESLVKQRFQRLTAEATATMGKFASQGSKVTSVPPAPLPASASLASVSSTGAHQLETSQSQSAVVHHHQSSNTGGVSSNTANTTPVPLQSSSFSAATTFEQTATTPAVTTTITTTSSKISSSPPSSPQPQTVKPWHIPQIRCPKDRTLWAQIGPVGGARGYQAITGRQGWGIAWYINGLLIPEVVLKRGVTYTFLVEGGNDENNGARRHPLYLTDSPEGGFEFKTAAERAKERVFGGVGITANGTIAPTAEGRMCEYKITPRTNIHDIGGTYHRFEDFQKTLMLDCDKGRPGVIKFTPDQNTPNTLYYQCFTHRYLGWRIKIVDDCNTTGDQTEESSGGRVPVLHSAASVISSVKLPAPPSQIKDDGAVLVGEKKPVQQTQKQQKPKQQQQKHSSSVGYHQIVSPQQHQMQQQSQRRPLVAGNVNPSRSPAVYPATGPYASLYGGNGAALPPPTLQRHHLNLLPHTMLQGYHQHYHHHQHQQQQQQQQQQQLQYQQQQAQQIQQMQQLQYISPPQQPQQTVQAMIALNPYPIQQQQQHQQAQNIFNPPKAVMVNPAYYFASEVGAVTTQPQLIGPLQQQQQPILPPVNPTYPMKKFGHRPLPQPNTKPTMHHHHHHHQQQQQQQHFSPTPYYGSRQSALKPMTSRRPHMPLKPTQHQHQQHQQLIVASSTLSFGPTSTKPPMHGGFVPITLESTANRAPVAQDSKSQNVWFPAGASNQSSSFSNYRLNNNQHNKPLKPIKKKPTDIYRIVTTPESSLYQSSTTSTSTTTSTTSTTTTTTSTTTTPATPTARNSEVSSTTTTTATSSLPNKLTTPFKLANETAYELLTFVPMDAAAVSGVKNGSSASVTESTSAAGGGFSPDKFFTDVAAEEVGEESQRRQWMSSWNGFEHLPNRQFESKPGTVDHVLTESEKSAAATSSSLSTSGNNDETQILADVLRLISFNIPSGRRESSYTPGFIPKK